MWSTWGPGGRRRPRVDPGPLSLRSLLTGLAWLAVFTMLFFVWRQPTAPSSPDTPRSYEREGEGEEIQARAKELGALQHVVSEMEVFLDSTGVPLVSVGETTTAATAHETLFRPSRVTALLLRAREELKRLRGIVEERPRDSPRTHEPDDSSETSSVHREAPKSVRTRVPPKEEVETGIEAEAETGDKEAGPSAHRKHNPTILLWQRKRWVDQHKTDPCLPEKIRSAFLTCPHHCTIVCQPDLLEHSSAVVVDGSALLADFEVDRADVLHKMPSRESRPPGQMWYLYGHAAEGILSDPDLQGFFDATISHRASSEVSLPLNCALREIQEELRTQTVTKKMKSPVLASFLDDCGTEEETTFLKDLNHLIDIDFYGRCLHSRDLEAWGAAFAEINPRDSQELSEFVMSQYKLTLFVVDESDPEGSASKAARMLLTTTVPVYLHGSLELSEFLPHPKAVVDARSMRSPRQVAAFLNVLQLRPPRYAEYVLWRQEPETWTLADGHQDQDNLCDMSWQCHLCIAVHKQADGILV